MMITMKMLRMRMKTDDDEEDEEALYELLAPLKIVDGDTQPREVCVLQKVLQGLVDAACLATAEAVVVVYAHIAKLERDLSRVVSGDLALIGDEQEGEKE